MARRDEFEIATERAKRRRIVGFLRLLQHTTIPTMAVLWLASATIST